MEILNALSTMIGTDVETTTVLAFVAAIAWWLAQHYL